MPRVRESAVPGLKVRVAILDASHNHAPYVLDALANLPHVSVVAVSDADAAVARHVADRFSARAYTDDEALIRQQHPEFVFAFGLAPARPPSADLLIESGVPCSLEKPVGSSAADVLRLEHKAAAAGVFVSVPFVFRLAGWVARIKETCARLEPPRLAHASFRLVAGMHPQYATSGRGCATHVSAHFVDLFRHLTESDVRCVAAAINQRTSGFPIEDYAAMLLETRTGGATCVVESGYTMLGPARAMDFGCAARTTGRSGGSYFQVGIGWLIETRADTAQRTELATRSRDFYAAYVADALARAGMGEPPLANLGDMYAVLQVVEMAYQQAG